MVQFEFADDAVYVRMAGAMGDLKAKIEYGKFPTLATLSEDEKKQLGAILGTVVARLNFEQRVADNNFMLSELRKLQPLVIAPEEKKLIVPGV